MKKVLGMHRGICKAAQYHVSCRSVLNIPQEVTRLKPYKIHLVHELKEDR